MSAKYLVFVNQENHGPFTLEEMQSLEATEQITGTTMVKGEEASMWSPWQEIRPSPEISQQDTNRVISSSSGGVEVIQTGESVSKLEFLRRLTNYPVLRAICLVIIVLSILSSMGLIIGGLVELSFSLSPWCFLFALIPIGNVVAVLFLIMLIDIADTVVNRSGK